LQQFWTGKMCGASSNSIGSNSGIGNKGAAVKSMVSVMSAMAPAMVECGVAGCRSSH
jgi:hypothetical protein